MTVELRPLGVACNLQCQYIDRVQIDRGTHLDFAHADRVHADAHVDRPTHVDIPTHNDVHFDRVGPPTQRP